MNSSHVYWPPLVTEAEARRRVGRHLDRWGCGEPEPAGIFAVWRRPPLGPPRYGARSTAGGRGHRRSASDAAAAVRRGKCYRAWLLRLSGLSVRDIAREVGVSKTLAGRWVRGVPALDFDLGDLMRAAERDPLRLPM